MPIKPENRILAEERKLLIKGTKSLGLVLSQKQIEAIFDYLNLLLLWNSRFNLTSIRSPEKILRLHFIDSLAIVKFLNPKSRLMDFGSGAGFPGIPIKIIYPEKELHLVEARRKKANFLSEVTRHLGLKGVHVHTKRGEKIRPQEVGLFSELVTRASGTLQDFLRISAPLLLPGGKGLIMGGPTMLGALTDEKTMKYVLELGFIESQLETYFLPIGKEKRILLIYTKG